MDGNQTSVLTRRRFLVTGVTAAGGFMIGISALPHLARAVTVSAQPWKTTSRRTRMKSMLGSQSSPTTRSSSAMSARRWAKAA
ncbi:MAG TPA: hypothetical protein VKV32_06725 [Stellaceae bacterium]|nr:hypothetical protein [Stellaceae bacterium]